MQQISLTRELAARGYHSSELDRLTRSGELHRVRRGAYELSGVAREPAESHQRLVAATLRQTPLDAVVSHTSAAALHGLPTWSDGLARVHLTRDQDGRGKVRTYVHLHAAPLPADDVMEVDGRPVTTLARTVVDLARSMDELRAVSVGDAAHARGMSRHDVERVVSSCAGWPGIAGARRVVALLDGRSESVGESFSRVIFARHTIPAASLQYAVRDSSGHLVGRADFAWPELRTLGEFDGREKYGRLLKPGQTAGDALFDEKRREDALRDLGWQVVRWVWDDLQPPGRLIERLERAFARGRRAP